MDSNTHSIRRQTKVPDRLASLTAAVDDLATQDLDGLPDTALAEQVLQLRRLVDRLEGHWLAELAAVDARGAAGADQGTQAPSTAGWLRHRLHLGAGAASSCVRTARALFRGPLARTATALTNGAISPAHASVVAAGTQDLAAPTAAQAEPVLLEAAGRLDPPRLRRVVAHLQLVADPEGAEARADRQHQRRGLWLSPTLEGMVALDGLLEPEAGQTLVAALEPLARPASAADTRSGGQRRADALGELARRALGRWVGRPGGRGRWPRRRVGGWPVTGRSPGSWSPANPAPTATTATTPPAPTTTTTPAAGAAPAAPTAPPARIPTATTTEARATAAAPTATTWAATISAATTPAGRVTPAARATPAARVTPEASMLPAANRAWPSGCKRR
jgi:hypothetical protein